MSDLDHYALRTQGSRLSPEFNRSPLAPRDNLTADIRQSDSIKAFNIKLTTNFF